MEAKKHRAYSEESANLKETINWIEKKSDSLKQEGDKVNAEISALRKEVSTALDERLLLKEQMRQMVEEDLDKLDKVKLSPYFGRIDFQERFKEELETVYIGKFGLYDSEQGELLVLDWRAPMSNIYYSGMDEEVSYRTPVGTVEGKMHLKRRYVMNEGELTEIHDEKSLQDNLRESIAKDSGFLVESLNKSTSGRLTEIVATIQDQQNKIIRSEGSMPLIVQGVAGSGKTTIALHRMAYLIYNRQQDREAKYMVIAPNKLFLNYIEDILPDLGVDNVFQTTFEEWALSKLDKKVKLVQGSDKLNTLLSEPEEYTRIIALAAKLRGSMLLKRVIDIKLSQFERSIIDRNGICFEGINLITFKELQEVFLVSNKHLALQERVKLFGEYLKKRLKDKKEFIEECMRIAYQKRINELKESVEDIEQVRPQIIALYDERDEKIKGIKKWIITFVREYIKGIKIPKAHEFYINIFQEQEELDRLISKQVDSNDLQEVVKLLQANYQLGKFETEDLGPLVYAQIKLYGTNKETKYSHIVVDEAQDLDEMKLSVLREVSANDAFTLVGDTSQGIYSYKGINDWKRMMTRVFEGEKYNYHEMTTSYRSTIEIVELANEVISKCMQLTPTKAVPVFRHGEKPSIVKCKDEESRLNQIIKDIAFYQDKGMHSICVLTENKETSEKVYQSLRAKHQEIIWIKDDQEVYNGEVAIMPSYLSKGLEFDVVLIYDVEEKSKEVSDLDIKLLYVMITRALHHLKMYSIGKEISILSQSKWVKQELE